MDINEKNFPSNSINKDTPASQDKKTNIETIVSKGVVTKKKSTFLKVIDSFIANDTKSVKDYVIMDIIVPAVKDMVVESTKGAVERLFYGGEKRSNDRISRARISYNKISNRGVNDHPRIRTLRDFQNIILVDRVEAENVIERMNDLLDQYGAVTVADLYDLVGITGDYTDNKWGWTSMYDIRTRRVRDGYLLDLPNPITLDR